MLRPAARRMQEMIDATPDHDVIGGFSRSGVPR
jgi:hypothetical protein